jgi:uncharacterized protein YqhQ
MQPGPKQGCRAINNSESSVTNRMKTLKLEFTSSFIIIIVIIIIIIIIIIAVAVGSLWTKKIYKLICFSKCLL